jgi:probable F420-dependent oxidoreductase
MRFGVQHGVGDPAWTPPILQPNNVRKFALAAEGTGFDALGFTDHPSPSARWLESGGEGSADPFSALGFCAAVTSRIRLMPFVLVASNRNPLLAAHQLATLDALSEGRLTVGLGTGYLRSEIRALGGRPDDRRDEFDEAIDLMTRAWAGETITHESAHFKAREVRVPPGVVQKPHPPLWIHGNSTWGTERAARYGQGWLAIMMGNPGAGVIRTRPMPDVETLRIRIDELRERIDAAGRDPKDVEIAVSGQWPMLDVRRGWDTDARLADVAALEELGVTWIVALTCGDDPAAAEDTVRAFGEQIVQPTRTS